MREMSRRTSKNLLAGVKMISKGKNSQGRGLEDMDAFFNREALNKDQKLSDSDDNEALNSSEKVTSTLI